MQLLEQARAWLAALHPEAPWAAVTAVTFLVCYLWRLAHRASWDKVAALIPKSDTSQLQLWAHRFIQAWPGAAIGAVVAAVGSGEGIGLALKGVTWGLVAPGIVLTAQIGRSLFAAMVKRIKRPPGSGAAVGLIALCLALGGCAGVPPALAGKDPGALVKGSTALAYNGAAVALELLDKQEAEYLDSLAKPTDAELAASTVRRERLRRARDLLAIAQEWLSGKAPEEQGIAALRDALKLLQLMADELKAAGVFVPPAALKGLSAASTFVGES